METQPDFELRQHLQRFSTLFADRVTQAIEPLERSPRTQVRDEALRKNLRYISSAVEIASGPFAAVNLLDMMAFIRLSRVTLDEHWIPELYGPAGAELSEVFARSEAELRELAGRALTSSQLGELDEIVDTWLEENPEQVRVEGIRLSDFAAQAGTAAAATVKKAKGLLSSVTTATQTANQALLLSERALFLFNRMPFLWRLQARLAAREMVRDFTDGADAPLGRLTDKAQLLVRRGLVAAGLLAGAGVCVWGIRSLSRR
jgi:hypothetical protein